MKTCEEINLVDTGGAPRPRSWKTRPAAAFAVMLCAAIWSGCAWNGGPPPQKDASLTEDGQEKTITVDTASLHGMPEQKANQTPGNAPVSKADKQAIFAYKIGYGDVLDFRLLEDETYNGMVAVRYDGFISLPMVPDIYIVGKTREEAKELVRSTYKSVFQDPTVSLSVRQPMSKTFTVMGNINQPGQRPYTRPITLLDAINAGGGMRLNQRGGDSYVGAQGELTKAFIIRHDRGVREVTGYDLRGMRKSGPHPSDAPVLPGDIVYIPEGINLVYLVGEVPRSGVFQLTEGMTVLKLMAKAGGLNEMTGRLAEVVLMREVDGQHTTIELVNIKRILKGGADPLLVPGDVIYVPRKRITKLGTFVSQYTGTVSPVLNLYRQAYDSYYTRERYETLYGGNRQSGAAQTQALEQFLFDIVSSTGIAP